MRTELTVKCVDTFVLRKIKTQNKVLLIKTYRSKHASSVSYVIRSPVFFVFSSPSMSFLFVTLCTDGTLCTKKY